ncbi:NAD+ diphosphatase [Marchantia polymorpha subsp. ruderalis]|uniref:NAD(+) diphosphatase n=2 Tax=Marchantia polymorpha TaxID=3197 RepID=A0AAF6AJY5_MARPO|nr:hypothetical protein MARPO_0103s0044 [Marchantia polymorpha]BBM96755.1 hypothetical protein Mp_1g00430 [Marchantia polymorpha subsp. ruderalis]|eukprot:PTQ32073.1 hypothetical protein MARPO_0103s0044 [Marchantia polymorpha]
MNRGWPLGEAGKKMELVNMFAGNPLIPGKRSVVDPRELEALLLGHAGARALPVLDGRPLVAASRSAQGVVNWSLCWQNLEQFGSRFPFGLGSLSGDSAEADLAEGELVRRKYDRVVYLGDQDGVPCFAIDVSKLLVGAHGDASTTAQGLDARASAQKLAQELAAVFSADNPGEKSAFIDLRTLMLAADWRNKQATEQVAIGGHARALLEWHKQAQFCGRCGTKTVATEAGQRRQCSNQSCKNKLYPRTDPVVIMLVIDKERDCVILARQSRFLPRMWSCLAGFIEAGESLEEAVRRETQEEVGINIDRIVYHSSQPWPVGPSSKSCELMVGFFAYATSFDIKVDGVELQDAQWFNRESVLKALTYTDYRNAQEASSLKVYQYCSGEKTTDSFSEAPMYVPGPYAIAHNLIATWANVAPDSLLSKV